MSKATEDDLGTLHGAIARGLTTVIKDGVPTVVKGDEGDTVVNMPASAAFFMAGITLLKNNNITADAGSNKELDDLTKALQERRQKAKGRLSRADLDAAAETIERDLGGMLGSLQ